MSGFDGRMFLTQPEWETYMRRMPVRFIKKAHSGVCVVCGKPAEQGNPLEHSHLIGFSVGVKKFALSPDFLDSDSNIKSAHKRGCNAALELKTARVADYLKSQGHILPYWLPE